MASRLDVSRFTLRQGLKDLAQMGLVATRPGAGTVVVGRIPKALSRLSGFTEDMQLRGLLATSKVLERIDRPGRSRHGVPHRAAARHVGADAGPPAPGGRRGAVL